MIFKLFNKKEKFIGEINNATQAIETKQTRGVRIFDFILPSDNLTKQIEKYCRFIFQDDIGKWREYIVSKVVTRLDYQGAKIIMQAEDFTYELRRKIIEDKRPTDTTANIAAEQLFIDTRIEVGNTEDLGLSSVFFYRENKKEAFNKLLDAWDCEYDSYVTLAGNKITHRYVDLVHRLGEFRGKRYEYSRDLEEVERTVQSDDVYTALYGFGKGEEIGDGYGRRINFENIEWKTSSGKPLNKPIGQRYIADDSLLEEWGVPDKDGNMTHSFGIVTFDDEEDPVRVLENTHKAFLELSQPKAKYTGKVIDLNRLMGMNYDAVALGDEVLILDLKISGGILIRARVLEYKKDWLNPSNDIITLGNYSNILANKLLENEKQINKIRDKSGAWDKADFFDKDGLPSQHLKNLIDELNTKMNTTGGYTYFREGRGIEILNKPESENPTESMMLGGGYIAIADTKKPNGEWDYKTFGTGAGFTADLIRTGILQGGKVKFDLTNGTLLIGNSIDDYSLLFDGNSLKIRLSSGKTIEEEVSDNVDNAIQNAPIYTWIKYSQNPDGANMTDNPTDAKYIGIAEGKTSTTPSNVATDYKWTKIAGEDGKDGIGIKGETGADGKTSYLHIKYSNDGGQSFTGNGGEDAGSWIGTYTDFTQSDSTSLSKYTWVKIKGEEGDSGPQGIPGPKGDDGETYYTWVKYADSPTSGISNNPMGKEYIGIAHNKLTATESTNYSDYTWAKIKGEQGIPGTDGDDGVTTYTWIKYADDELGNGMSDSPVGKRYLGMAFNKTTATESNTASDYNWSPLYDNVKVGGRNYLQLTDFNTLDEPTIYGQNLMSSSTQTKDIMYNINNKYYEQGEYTLSFEAKVEEGNTVSEASVRLSYKDSTLSSFTTKMYMGRGELTDEWKKITYTFSIEEPTRFSLQIYNHSFGTDYNSEVYTRHFKLEKGNIATDWTPAPEDIEAEIQTVQDNLDGFQTTVNTTFKDGIIEESEAKAISKYINTLQSQQQQIYKMHQSIYNNEHLTGTYKVEENTAYNNYITAFNNLVDYINGVIVDEKVTDNEAHEVDLRFDIYKDRIATYQEKLNNAQEFIQSEIKRKTEEFAQEKADEVQGTVNTQTEELTVNFTSDLQATAESVTNTMRAEYQNADNEVIKAYEKKIKETAETWRLSFTSLQNDINGTNNQLNEVTTFFDFGAENLTIGKTDSKIKMTLQNDKLAIVDNGVESQYFDNQNAYIKNLIVENDAQLGNHMFKKNGEKTLIQWAGEN